MGDSRRALWQEQYSVLSRRLEEIGKQLKAITNDSAKQEAALAEARRALLSKSPSCRIAASLSKISNPALKPKKRWWGHGEKRCSS